MKLKGTMMTPEEMLVQMNTMNHEHGKNMLKIKIGGVVFVLEVGHTYRFDPRVVDNLV